ncbi:ATP-dependent DNA helicase RecG [Reyranella sp.]|uniref:ATP-dependent DNA helicase RecG n=1 Tax=Reyranella sp. TaxID=1929291 RepID=UPI004037551D
MRPLSLTPLFAHVTSLPGIGPRLGTLVEKLAGPLVVDLLWHLPLGVIDRRNAPEVAQARGGEVATLTVVVDEHLIPHSHRQPYKVWCSDESGRICLTYFNGREEYLKKLLPPGETRVISGKVEIYQGEVQMTHPDHVVPLDDRDSILRVEPVYGLTAGLTQRPVQKAIAAAVERAPGLTEWQDTAFHKKQDWGDWKTALARAHAPDGLGDLSPSHPARARLAYDELLASQLAIALVRHHNRTLAGHATTGDGRLRKAALASLGFELTASQTQAIAEIAEDLGKEQRMVRLLQGDVGSGKTLVALLAMLICVEAGAQAAMMAPTELLARQHFATIAPLAEAAGVKIALLTGRDGQRQKKQTLQGLADGTIQLVVGTHALVQEDVEFANLAMAVVDEQHRFGVHQRMALSSKGHAVDLLVMTATPIPRTLMLAAYGDLDVSKLTEKPKGRQPIDTRTIPLERLGEVAQGIGRQIAAGARVYWVCPLIEESEEIDLANVTERFRLLNDRFPGKVGLLHGRLKGAEREATMAAFSDGRLSILVATTVIEVGVDVPAATVMVIEHAERFGLAQLHQLRGRVGRGSAKSTCLLLYAMPLGETAKSRLAIMRETEDGFRIAEEDLKLRGAGELLGTRQSGLPDMRLADLAVHNELLEAARDDARLVIARDPDLQTERGTALRALLYLFRRDDAVRTLRAG